LIRNYLPYSLYSKLWGDRRKYSKKTFHHADLDWKKWINIGYTHFYQHMQQEGIGDWVCRLGYPILSDMDFSDKRVLEIGPGSIRHIKYITKAPEVYFTIDIEKHCLKMTRQILTAAQIRNEAILMDNRHDCFLPLQDESIDIIVSFYSLEHLDPLPYYLREIKRVLKKGGSFIGAIPCEGGFVWGIGRYITTRRHAMKEYHINYDKIICWEHPNFADFIIKELDTCFTRCSVARKPFPELPMDLNLVMTFNYSKT